MKTKSQNFTISRRSKFVLLVTFACLAPACNSSCKSRVATASKALASSITRSRDSKTEVKNSTEVAERRVYIDASLSMKGFVNPRNHSTFDEVIDELGDALPGCRLFKYGQRGQQPPQNVSDLAAPTSFGLELHEPAFYDLSYNPDDRLIDQLASEHNSAQPVLSVLITDGVYSEPEGSTSPPVVGAIQKWLGNGNAFGILVFKSAFNGPFYTERRRSVLPNVSVEQRPFYAFIFSPTVQTINDLRTKLQRRFPDLQSIILSSDAVRGSVTLPKTPALYTSVNPPTSSYYWQMLDASFFGGRPSATLAYLVNYSISPDYPASEFNANLVTQYFRWQQSQLKKLDGGTADGFNSQVEPMKNEGTGAAFRITVTLPKDQTTDYSFYDFKLEPSIKELRSEIRDLSTRDDSTKESAKKTYRFYELISALTEVHFKNELLRRASPPLFVTVANH